MKKFILLALMVPLLGACTQPEGTRIRINAKNYDAEKMNLAWSTPDGDYKIEPLTFENGKTEITIDVPEGTTLRLASLDSRNSIQLDRGIIPGPGFSFYAENRTIDISFDGDKWPEVTIKGGTTNNDMNRYWAQMGPLEGKRFEATRARLSRPDAAGTADPEAERIMEEQSAVQERFIADNPNSVVALDLLTQRFRQYEIADLEARFNKLGAKLRESEKGIALAERIAQAKSVMPGNPAPQFTKKDKDGKTVSLSDYRGKYVLIDFWGTWCGPCRSSHPHLVEMYGKYSPLGLEFINVAQEGSTDARDKWLAAVEEDGLVWTQILNDEGKDECDVVRLYSIQAFPTKVLIDPEGKLVGTWIGDSEEVEEKLAGIFGA